MTCQHLGPFPGASEFFDLDWDLSWGMFLKTSLGDFDIQLDLKTHYCALCDPTYVRIQGSIQMLIDVCTELARV